MLCSWLKTSFILPLTMREDSIKRNGLFSLQTPTLWMWSAQVWPYVLLTTNTFEALMQRLRAHDPLTIGELTMLGQSLPFCIFAGCYKITTVFSHAQTVVLCVGCSTVLCQPKGGKARLTEGKSSIKMSHNFLHVSLCKCFKFSVHRLFFQEEATLSKERWHNQDVVLWPATGELVMSNLVVLLVKKWNFPWSLWSFYKHIC